MRNNLQKQHTTESYQKITIDVELDRCRILNKID